MEAIISAIAGALTGALAGGLVSYLVWRWTRTAARGEALIHEKMRQRWNDARELHHLITELEHGLRKIQRGEASEPVIEKGRSDGAQARLIARRSRQLLGQDVEDLTSQLTDEYRRLFDASEAAPGVVDEYIQSIVDTTRRTRSQIDVQLQTPMPA